MSTDRVRYQRGTVEFHANTSTYHFRYRDTDRRRRFVLIGTMEQLCTAAKLKRAVDEMRAKINAELNAASNREMLMKELIEKYQAERLPKRQSTARGYLSKLRTHVLPRWGDTPVSEMLNSAYAVEKWLKELERSPKTKSHLRALLSVLIEYAMLRGFVPVGRNPMELVRIEGASHRTREPKVISHEEFAMLLSELREPFRTMALIAGAVGLRCSEIIGLKWRDIDFVQLLIKLSQGVVSGQEDELKTERSKSVLPLDPEVADAIARWKQQATFTEPEDWVFASPFTLGKKPYHSW